MATLNITPPSERGYVDSSLFVTTDWLAEHLDDPAIRILDTDLPDQYDRVHVPGAVRVTDHYYKTSLEDRTHIQGPDQFKQTMEDLGISDDTLVIGYDSSGGLYSMRLAWSLHYYGHTNVKMLDGGFPKWFAEGRPLSRQHHTYPQGSFTPRLNPEIFASRDDIIKAIDDPDAILLDVRTDAEWTGQNKRGTKRGGHIPTAVHLEWTNFHTSGDVPVLRNADELRKMLTDIGVTPDKNVFTY